MIEIRIHGRGGQGAVTTATLLAKAAGYDGKYSQAFGAFGPERRGAPVKAFCRIDNKPVTIRSQIYNPDYIILLDSSLVDLPEIEEGAKSNTLFILNSPKDFSINGKKTMTFDATKLALEILGKNIVNTAILGVFSKITRLVSLEGISKAIEEIFTGKIRELNLKIIRRAYEEA